MKNKEFRKLLKKNQPNSGFTLTELLVGLIMSGIVIGAFGYGLIQILRTTRTETSRINARSETSRAMEFIAEEIKRASAIESDATNANNFDATDRTVVLALDIPDISNNVNLDADADLLGSDTDPNTSERIVYYLEAASGTNWEGPLVLYRWGPPLDGNGDYTESVWQPEALIDGLDDTALSSNPCNPGDTLTPAIADAKTGFHACISGTNTAQLFFSGVTKDAIGDKGDSYLADTKVFVRSRNPNFANQEDAEDSKLSFRTLGATYNCDPSQDIDWTVRTDFGNNNSDPNDTIPWIHEDNRQAQPIDIDTSQNLVISTSPVGQSGCLSLGNEGTTGGESLSDYSHSVSFTIDFNDPTTFNGGSGDEPDVTGDGFVMIYKKGSTIAAYDGYDPDNNSSTDNQQKAIADFLVEKGYAVKVGSTYRLVNDTDTAPGLIKLADNERIIAVELGQTDNGRPLNEAINEAPWKDDNASGADDYYDPEGDGAHPGFDGQDSVFILSNDAFDTSTP